MAARLELAAGLGAEVGEQLRWRGVGSLAAVVVESASASPSSPPPTEQRKGVAWGAALKPAQHRAEVGRERLQQRRREARARAA